MATQSITFASEGADLPSLLQRAVQGCPEAFSELYASHYRYVLWICRRYFWKPEDAEDATAEVFLKLHRVLGSHDASQAFRPWLSQVTHRHCLDKLRRSERERRGHVDEEVIATLPDESTPSPLAQVLREESQSQLKKELDRLPESHRVPLVLHYYRQLSYEEIARVLGRSMPIVRALLFQARKKLRRNLQHPENSARNPKLAARGVSTGPFSSAVSDPCGAD
ncbi:MAG: RNA polymerase sigma factor [Acidobacteria bacterium]|nr:RNA polymerase sigma factor [Acidobacteriota bacterium]MCL5287154.1 RNA polymerase sigma factor [Acidobacteriota bacterium]